MKFELQATASNSAARAGMITTDHGLVPTPIFMPVGTLGSVKGVHMHELRDDIDAKIILGNTYHLYLRPGIEILRQAGGLHKFNGWERPILTDSGGFQVFSLSHNRKLKEDGAHFRSHIDGSKHIFTPEKTVDIQRAIGADIMMALDECTPGTADFDYARKSLDLTHRWLDRGWEHFNSTEPLYKWWRPIFYIINIWKETGWGTIIFLATLSGINPELYEAADIDGATRMQKIRYVTIPALGNNILTVLILNLAKVMNMFEPVFVLYNNAVYDVSDVISTYVYRLQHHSTCANGGDI